MNKPVYYVLASYPLAEKVVRNWANAHATAWQWSIILGAGCVRQGNMDNKLKRMLAVGKILDGYGVPWFPSGQVFGPGDTFATQLDPKTWQKAADGFEEIEQAIGPERIAIDFEPTWAKPDGEVDKYIRHTDPRAFDQIAAMEPLFDWYCMPGAAEFLILPGRIRWVMSAAFAARYIQEATWAEEYTYEVTASDWSRYERVKAAYEAMDGGWIPGFELERLNDENMEAFIRGLLERQIDQAFFFPKDQERFVKFFPTLEWWKP